MSYVFIGGEGMRLKKYTGATVGPKTVVRIEVEVAKPHILAHLLQELGEMDAEQKNAQLDNIRAVYLPGSNGGQP